MKKDPLVTDLIKGKTTKVDNRVIFFGLTDKLSSYIMELTHYIRLEEKVQNKEEIIKDLESIVRELSNIMAIVALYEKPFDENNLNYLLSLIKKYKKERNGFSFVLPGKTMLSAKTHIVRTITRECELKYAKVYEESFKNDYIFEYLNKLSTFFYELALYLED